MIQFGSWLPDVAPSLVVIDPPALAPPRPKDRNALLAQLQALTRVGGVHLILPTALPGAVIPRGPEALASLYDGWQITRRKRARAGAGFLATKPARQLDTALRVSD